MNGYKTALVSAVAAAAMLTGGCGTVQPGQGGSGSGFGGLNITAAQRDALIGAALGGVVGGVAGNNFGGGSGTRDKAILVGAALGGLAGHELGRQEDTLNAQQQQIQQLQLQAQMTTVWIENSNGSRSPVTLTRAQGGLWMGPRGEYYTNMPTLEQLKRVYGF